MEPIVCPETSVRNYHYPLRNNTEKGSSQEKFMFMYNPSIWVLLVVSQITQRHSVAMFATAYMGPSLDLRGFVQDVGCVTPMWRVLGQCGVCYTDVGCVTLMWGVVR
jgi:hypothetical protein